MPIETQVTRVEAPKALEYGDMRWELEPSGRRHAPDAVDQDQSRLRLHGSCWVAHFGSMCWITCSAGLRSARIAGADAMKFAGWQRLNAEYAKQFGVKAPNWPPQTEKKS